MLKQSLILATSLALTAAVAQAQAPAAPLQTLTLASESQRFAHDRLLEMARFLGSSQRFSVALRISYDAVQDDGQKIEFGAVRDVAVERPNRVRVAETSSDGSNNLMLFDGERITVSSGDGKSVVYAQTLQPGDIDATVVHYVRDLKLRLPLAPVLMSRLADELQRRLTGIDYVERSSLHGKPVHHIAGRTAAVDFQVWIADGKKPLPERIVITYKTEAGQPQFRADFSKWNLSPKFDKATFRFKPAANSSQIMFAVQVPPELIDTRGAAVNTKGELK
ncbi:MAG: DUF2092 domain-containing protein [Sulfuritalea sp.]|nr:DUF2092 domain-containing protein [Sulfuritalea sp.]